MTQHTNPVPVTQAKAIAWWNHYAYSTSNLPKRDVAISAFLAGAAHAHRLAQSTPADALSGEGLHLPWTADPDDRPGYEWNWHVFDAKGDRVCFMANGPDSEAKVRHLVATANTLRTAADPEPDGAQEVVKRAKRFFREWFPEWDGDQSDAIAEALAAALAALPQPPADEVKP